MLHTILDVFNDHNKYIKTNLHENTEKALLLRLDTFRNTVTLYILWFSFLFSTSQTQENNTGTVQFRGHYFLEFDWYTTNYISRSKISLLLAIVTMLNLNGVAKRPISTTERNFIVNCFIPSSCELLRSLIHGIISKQDAVSTTKLKQHCTKYWFKFKPNVFKQNPVRK